MKKVALVLVVLFGLVSLAWGEPPLKQVEVVNDLLNVNIQNQPVNVNIVNPSSQYEYKVFRLETGFPAEGVTNFQEQLNLNVSEGWEFVAFSYQQTIAPTHVFVAVMRKVIQ
jgi:hypothetical protein